LSYRKVSAVTVKLQTFLIATLLSTF